jgi:sulfonate transport system substrate-binding protein
VKRLFVILAAIFFFSAGSEASAGEALRISGWTKPFNLPVMIELDRGSYEKTFPEFGVSVVDMQTGPGLMAALEAGDVDIVQGIGDAAFLVAASEGVRAKIFAVNSRSPKAFAVVTNNPDVKTVADLKGRSVAGLRGSVVHQVFVAALAENGMTEADVEFFPMPVAQAASTLLAKKADAALLVGGDVTRALDAGARVLADGEGRVRGLSFAVVRTPFLEKHPDVTKRFAALRDETVAFIASDAKAALEIAARQLGQDVSSLEGAMSWYDFRRGITSEDIQSMENTKKYLLDNEIMRNDINIGDLFAE